MTYESLDPREAEARRMDGLRQQRKAVKVLATGNVDFIGEHDVDISDVEKVQVSKQLHAGELDNEVTQLLQTIQSPFSNSENERIALYDGILAHEDLAEQLDGLLRGQNQDAVYMSKVHAPIQWFDAFVEKYPTPDKYEHSIQEIIQQHEKEIQLQPTSDRSDMLKMDIRFRKKELAQHQPVLGRIYGKRFDYWNQIKALRESAALSEKSL